jgi:hypothetical protein
MGLASISVLLQMAVLSHPYWLLLSQLNWCSHLTHSSLVPWYPAPLGYSLPPVNPPTMPSQHFHIRSIDTTLLLLFIEGYECCQALRHHNGTWCPKFMDALWVCKTSSPKINLSVVLVTNTLVVSGRCPNINSTDTSFKMGRVLPEAMCRMYGPGQLSFGLPCSDV